MVVMSALIGILSPSERVKQTEAEGDRFKEAKNINQSLLTLGNVLKGKNDFHILMSINSWFS